MNTWRVDVTYEEETYMTQGHLDPLVELMAPTKIDNKTPMAEVEMQATISGQFTNVRVVSIVRLNCTQTTEKVNLAQEKATEVVMEGLRNGWDILLERKAKGHFPGCAQ